MPSLPALPAKNSSLRDNGATNVLYDKATREYVTRNFPAALSTLSIMQSQQLSLKAKRKSFSLYVAVLDSITSLPEKDLKMSFGRDSAAMVDKLRTGSIWHEAESVFGGDGNLPGDIAVNMILSLTRHMSSNAALQSLVENYLTTLDPASGTHDSVEEIYTLQVLPRCGDWAGAREYIECSDSMDERREAWLQALQDLRTLQDRERERLAKEAEDARLTELEAKKLRKVRKSRQGGGSSSKRSLPSSINGSNAGNNSHTSPHVNGKVNGHHGVITSAADENDELIVLDRSEAAKTGSTMTLLTNWTRSLSMRFSPRLVKTLLFLALLFGATGRREIRERIKNALKKAGSTIAAGFRVSYV